MNPIGYAWLINQYGLRCLPLPVTSYLLTTGSRRTIEQDGSRQELYTHHYDPGPSIYDQLQFALKHEGVNLEVLAAVFHQLDPHELSQVIEAKPRGVHLRRLWFLYEWLTGARLDCPDLKVGNYISLLDPEQYYTVEGTRSQRHRVLNNMPGTAQFCPLIRRTPALDKYVTADLQQKAHELVQEYDPALLARAIDFLYTKETKSSYEIEREVATGSRAIRFVALLRRAHLQLFNSKPQLVELQNAIVDAAFSATDYRSDQSYIGESSLRGERVHYICPKPEDVPDLMDGLLAMWQRIHASTLHPVVAAALVSFGFVFIHPFDDGNGRIHRFLIHNILAKSGFSPDGFIFPVSAAMARQMRMYDEALEQISRPLNEFIDYSLDGEGRMTVNGATAQHYRYLDFTHIAEQLFAFVQDTIETDLVEELDTLTRMDSAKAAIQDIVDMPDSLIYLFVRLVHQNAGQLSASKRSRFAQLTEDRIARMEAAVREAFGLPNST